jgi:hypothetical protein
VLALGSGRCVWTAGQDREGCKPTNLGLVRSLASLARCQWGSKGALWGLFLSCPAMAGEDSLGTYTGRNKPRLTAGPGGVSRLSPLSSPQPRRRPQAKFRLEGRNDKTGLESRPCRRTRASSLGARNTERELALNQVDERVTPRLGWVEQHKAKRQTTQTQIRAVFVPRSARPLRHAQRS